MSLGDKVEKEVVGVSIGYGCAEGSLKDLIGHIYAGEPFSKDAKELSIRKHMICPAGIKMVFF